MKIKREKEKQGRPKPTGLAYLMLKPLSSIQDENPILAKTSETYAVMEIYEPFLLDGSVSILKSYEILVLHNPLSWQILGFSQKRLLLGQVSLHRGYGQL